MKLATWNVNSLAIRLPQLLSWLAANEVDVIVLQETKLSDDRFPHAEIEAAGYEVKWFGQKTYNGVALLSRLPIVAVQRNIPGFDDEQARVIAATAGPLRVIGAYCPNGQSPESDKFGYKLRWYDALHGWLHDELQQHGELLLMGDFNVAPDDRDVHDPVLWEGQILCTPQERAKFHALIELGLHDSFRLFEQPPKTFSWWDYRQLGFQKNRGLRIDHILVSEALKGRVSACTIDRQARKAERPSDHAPVVVELVG